jgi:cob(I)alamin adenosyltransferase
MIWHVTDTSGGLLHKGLLQVYTGDGKGKTTSAVGLAVRARSRGLRVLFAQFMKSGPGGETEILKEIGVEVIRFERVLSPHFHPEADRGEIRREALEALAELAAMLPRFDLAVLDEFNNLLSRDLITMEEAEEFLRAKPEGLELVLTGRGAPEELIALADQVTEMKDIKHPSRAGVPAREGIEY